MSVGRGASSSISISVTSHVLQHGSSARAHLRANAAGVTLPRLGGNTHTRTGLSDERRARRASSISSSESYIAGTAAARLCARACQCSWCNVAAFGGNTPTHALVCRMSVGHGASSIVISSESYIIAGSSPIAKAPLLLANVNVAGVMLPRLGGNTSTYTHWFVG